MNKAIRPCRQPGCPNLVEYGYCNEHKIDVVIESKQKAIECIRRLDDNKTDEEREFYNSPPWKRTRKKYRIKHPLCERCESRGWIKDAELVHHKKELRNIWAEGGNPLSWRYLQALCHNCHMEDFRAKKNIKDNKKKYKY